MTPHEEAIALATANIEEIRAALPSCRFSMEKLRDYVGAGLCDFRRLQEQHAERRAMDKRKVTQARAAVKKLIGLLGHEGVVAGLRHPGDRLCEKISDDNELFATSYAAADIRQALIAFVPMIDEVIEDWPTADKAVFASRGRAYRRARQPLLRRHRHAGALHL